MAKEKTWNEIMKEREAKNVYLTDKRFKNGQLPKFLVIEHATKISNELKVVEGADVVNKIEKLTQLIRSIKYKLPKYGIVGILDERENQNNYDFSICKILEVEDYGTGIPLYIDAELKQITKNKETFAVRRRWSVNKRFKKKLQFVVEDYGFNISSNKIVDINEINKIIGYKIYQSGQQKIKTPYIPVGVIYNNELGLSELEGLEEIFDLERQLLKEIPRDLDLSRKKILYKTRLASKGKLELEVEMLNDNIVVFQDGDSIFSSPIDLWSPALAIKTITETIDWLINHVLKMSFAARDSMSTGTNKLAQEIVKVDQAPNNYLEDKIESWSDSLSEFFTLIYDKTIRVEFQSTDTIEMINNPEPQPNGDTPPKKEGDQ